jgi:1-phosphatidylinositol phosphodiesterase
MDMLSDGTRHTKSTNEASRLRGWALLDYYEDPEPALVPLLVEFNFVA